ncbi:type II toxin-antitoxin system VapC family toxin [Tsukamurella soli]|uniref:Ribonuclease VapC n=1 Tax=Tsukamurella soli TaxID=644556 RepID=A0ABP8J6R6_9ACTN
MIILDTNVVSEPLRGAPDGRVVDWLDAQSIDTLYLTTITVGELRYGVAAMPPGRRRDGLRHALDEVVETQFAERVIPYGIDATTHYARLMSDARARGRAIGTADGMIAAIAASMGFTVASRDIAPFEAAGVPVVDPWGR